MKIKYDDFRSFINTINGQSFHTLYRKVAFDVHVDQSGLKYTPASSGKPRIQKWKFIERVVLRYEETGSIQPSDYQDITANASYLLTLINHYLNKA
jgi:hypothetical protein